MIILFLKFRFAVLCLLFVILEEPDMVPVQMNLSKYKMKLLQHIGDWFYMIFLQIGLFKYISLL